MYRKGAKVFVWFTSCGVFVLCGTIAPANVVTDIDGFLLTVLSRTACGAIIPVIAKVFMWYGMAVNKKPDS
jgi:hypothetical protein